MISFRFGKARLIMRYSVYHDLYIGGAVVFNQADQFSDFCVRQIFAVSLLVFESDCDNLGILNMFIKFEVLGI